MSAIRREEIAATADAERRPRERLLSGGPASLSDVELVAILIGHGTAGRRATDVAAALLRDVGGVHGITRGSRSRLARTPGIGAAKTCRLLAAIELGRRTLFISPPARVPLADPVSVAAFLLPRYGAHPTERLGVLLLDSRHRLIRPHIVSEGGTSATLAEPHDVFREATIAHASAVILFHNHPSGDPTPSEADLQVTRRMVDAGKIVGIDVLDHFVLADRSYCAMRALTRSPWRE
jgi:DNA repair protein RadC